MCRLMTEWLINKIDLHKKSLIMKYPSTLFTKVCVQTAEKTDSQNIFIYNYDKWEQQTSNRIWVIKYICRI